MNPAFDSTYDLTYILERKHINAKFAGKHFRRKEHLKMHMIEHKVMWFDTHTGEEPYNYDVCRKFFGRKCFKGYLMIINWHVIKCLPGRVRQLVTCLATAVSSLQIQGWWFRSRPGPILRGDWSWNNLYSHSPPFCWIIQEGLLSVTSESMCTKYWLTACSSLPRKKCG